MEGKDNEENKLKMRFLKETLSWRETTKKKKRQAAGWKILKSTELKQQRKSRL